MDYEQMSVQELRAESVRRGLGTARARADLIQRLTESDAAGSTDDDFSEPDATSRPDDDAPAEPLDAPVSSPTPVRVFHLDFPAEPDGPDEETHLSNRQATLQAAIEAGHTPRGDARLAATVDGRWVYEILVRRVT